MSIAEKLTAVADNQQAVYDAGVRAGKAQGGDSHYDTFWDAYQENGQRDTYNYAFAGVGWDNNTFAPKYSLAKASTCNYMFAQCKMTDLSHLPKMNMKYAAGYVYWQARELTHIGVVQVGGTLTLTSFCQEAGALHTFEKLIVQSGNKYTNAFHGCTSLVNITFEGTIGNSINFKDSPLSRASLENILSVLSTTATGQTVTVKRSAVDAAFTQAEWTALTAQKPNWTVNCV